MKTKPQTNYKSPSYPRIERIFEEPSLLSDNMPKSWKANKALVSAMLVFALAGCKSQHSFYKTHNTEQTLKNGSDENPKNLNNNQNENFKVAPIFVHGKGVGAAGCVMVSPPVFLSESDAKKIISEILEAKGYSFNDIYDQESIKYPRKKSVRKKIADKWIESDSIENVSIIPCAFNKKNNFVINFVSVQDCRNYANENEFETGYSLDIYEVKIIAERINKFFNQNPKFNTVVFYDPITKTEHIKGKNREDVQKEAYKKSAELLKQQVEDFIEWLEDNGIFQK